LSAICHRGGSVITGACGRAWPSRAVINGICGLVIPLL
jgi:hypothetical protein